MRDPKSIEAAANNATLNDLNDSVAILDYAKKQGIDITQAAAICMRFGVRKGNAYGKRKAHEAYMLLHEYQGREDKKRLPAKRIIDASKWIKNPAELRELAAFLEGQAAAVEACIAKFPDDDYQFIDGDNPNAWFNNDVNSDGTEEVK